MLRQLHFQQDYRSGHDNLLDDFFRPCLAHSQFYWRAAGYFSSSALEALGAPLDEFVRRGGTMRLLTSVELSARDAQAIERGQEAREISEARIEQIIEEQFQIGVGNGTSRLLALLQTGRLELKLAVPTGGKVGIYHEKVGLFFDGAPEDGSDFVAFAGSTNESRSAFQLNYECVDVFSSWGDASRAAGKRSHFETLWANDDPGALVFSFPEAAKQKLIRLVEHTGAPSSVGASAQSEATSPADEPAVVPDAKWRHQEEAREAFLRHERGILEMATGTGKTRTALALAQELFERGEIDTVIIAMHGTDLLNQWSEQIFKARHVWGKRKTVYRHYDDHKEGSEFSLSPRDAVLLCSREPLENALKKLSASQAQRTLIIHDEVHGLGSPANCRKLDGLSDDVRFRLGLSATPDREYDDVGNDFIERNVGPTIYQFGLKEAIERGILAPFDYHALPFHLSDEDKKALRNVHAQQKASTAAGTPLSPEDVATKIAFIYKNSRQKLAPFREFVERNPSILDRCIIFVQTKEYGEEVAEIIHTHRPDYHTYFAENETEVLHRFARSELGCLITCHRLSQGIDIRSLRSVVLFASDRARLETIQRIGRCLRTDPDAPDKVATIVDFVRQNEDNNAAPNSDQERADWLQSLSEVRATPIR